MFRSKRHARNFFAASASVLLLFSLFVPRSAFAVGPDIVLSESGWSDPAIGNWDSDTRIGTLTSDVVGSIQITADDIVLDGNGHTLSGNGSGAGVSISEHTGVSVRNISVNGFFYGLYVNFSTGVTLDANTLGINNYGIYLNSSDGNIISNNSVSDSSATGIFTQESDSNTISGNEVRLSGFGIFLGRSSLNTVSNNIAASNGLHGITLDSNSNSNTVADNSALDNGANGIALFLNSSGNVLSGNTSSGNGANGLLLYFSPNNVVSNNVSEENFNGIQIGSFANDNSIVGNTVRNNSNYGIFIFDLSTTNTVKYNTVSGNGIGVQITNASNNSVYNNNFVNNAVQVSVETNENTFGNVFYKDLPVGGNHWSDGISPDADNDGLLDEPYIFSGGFDAFPWIGLNGWLSLPPSSDVVAPTTAASLSGTQGNNSWYISAISVELVATDNQDGTGVASTEYSFDGSSWNLYVAPFEVTQQGETMLYWRSTDNAGNVEEVLSQMLRIDTSPPEIVIATPQNNAEYLLHQIVNADWSSNDSVSGLLSTESACLNVAALDTLQENVHTCSVTAEDNAGNVITQNVTYYVRYAFGGFLQPINSDGSSIFKLKGSVKVAFQLFDANGNPVDDAVAKLTWKKLSSSVSGSSSETVITEAATEGNIFRYDADKDQYFFNIKAKALSAGTWQLSVSLDDGTVYTVNISVN